MIPSQVDQNIISELNKLRTAFEAAHTLIADGAEVDLTGMDDRVRDFCSHVEAADTATRRAIEPDFAALLHLLDTLEQALRRAHEARGFKVDAPPGDR